MFHEQLKTHRKKQGWTQEQLAKKLDVSRQTISQWETGVSMPDLDTVIQLSEIFNTSTDQLLKNRKSDSDYSYYTVAQKPKKQMHEAKMIALVTLSLSTISLLTLLVITIIKPLVYTGSSGKVYQGFMAYFMAYGEFSLAIIFSLFILTLSIVTLFMSDAKLTKMLHKKNP